MSKIDNPFHLPLALHILSSIISIFKPIFIILGNIESLLLKKSLLTYKINKPVYISGLARAGSTILLEFLSNTKGVTTHRYTDFPAIYTPYSWGSLVEKFPPKNDTPQERPHKDGIMITLKSPEAMEEILWMSFFKNLHNPALSNLLTESTSNRSFEKFYIDHIKKILIKRGGNRYISKANYNVTRIPYIQKILPNSKFILLVRDPQKHIAAFIKQQKYICNIQRKYPLVLSHFNKSGHFEYGLNMQPVNSSLNNSNDDILELFKNGKDVRAWARYWSRINRYIFDISKNKTFAESILLMKYEDLCNSSKESLLTIVKHCNLECDKNIIDEYSKKLSLPTYYNQSFSDNDLKIIKEETKTTAKLLGYET